MGRKRFITSDMSIDEKIAQIAAEDPTIALMWPWFITGFDDWGRMEAAPLKIKLSIFPAFPFTAKDIERAIDKYAEVGLVFKYVVEGHTYIAIEPEKYYKYQTYIRDNKRESDKSNCPAPENAPWNSQNSADKNKYAQEDNMSRNCAQVSVDNDKKHPSPSPSPSPSLSLSPSPSENISTSEQSPDMPQKPQNEVKKSGKHIIPVFSEDTIQFQLAMFMRQCILKNLPKARVPEPTIAGLKRWAYDIDLMIRIDKRDPEEIRSLIDWSHRDNFWRANILSPGKLREKWDTLTAHKMRNMQSKGRADPGEMPKNVAKALELVRKAEEEEKTGKDVSIW
ncbi:hypothetical protein PQV03_09930 [Thermoanaerobacterium thermosaccharolyticum]|uniref:hypothetical protein n=1 Tax=Thermoanaerobacterium thermosaccharolyticum TaxID=1517 RepID=UPI003D28DDA3